MIYTFSCITFSVQYIVSRIGGGNTRGLVLINWHPKLNYRVGAREIMEKLRIFALVDAKEISDLEPKKFLEEVSKGKYAYGLAWGHCDRLSQKFIWVKLFFLQRLRYLWDREIWTKTFM